ncbi:MAG TPA: molybdopterin-synthase adenylyltransferase MoeB [Candidatus Binatia bacterium]|jgi:adenylyltransferase/sulfurtransferase|nr:molybdopterin-synthase adenylyltransferase MoeB [Candidatus Binatia bacterium]
MARTYQQIMDEAREVVPEVSPDEVKTRIGATEKPVVLDVREREEYRQGFLPGAVSIPRGFLEMRIEDTVPDHGTPIVAYCAGGTRSLLAGRILRELGYANVVSMRGGYTAWKNQGLPIVEERQFTAEQQIRYSRHFLLPEVGETGQAKLLDAKVLCIGAGGLGSPVAFYLAAAGVGTIGLVDMDTVDLSNLQRQILHTNDRIGMAKTESAKLTLNALNPDVKVLEFRERLSSENAFRIMEQFDVIVNGCDNFPTRYLANDACVMLGKPLVDGAIWQFEGQATVFHPPTGPCYRCMFPEPPPPGSTPSCAEAGVLGVLPGLVGCVQALETIKIILGKGKPLLGRMMHFDTLTGDIRILKLRRDPKCVVCGENPTVRTLIDYEVFCGLGDPGAH